MTSPMPEPPPAVVDPLEQFYAKDPVAALAAKDPALAPFPTSTADTDADKNLSPLAIALGAAFIAAAVLTARAIAKQSQEPEEARKSLTDTVTQVFAPTFIQSAVPALLRMYVESGQFAAQMASAHADALGKHLASSSVDAVMDGYMAGMNKGLSPQTAWLKATAGFGLTQRDMRSLLTAETQQQLPYEAGVLSPRGSQLMSDLLTRRANLIGRDEMFAAASVARIVGWMAKVSSGELPGTARKRWVTATDERVCPTCAPMDRRTARLDEPFTLPGGVKIQAPPVHPNCRCSVMLVNPRRVKIEKRVTISKDYVRTPAGQEKYGLPMGAKITADAKRRAERQAAAAPAPAAAQPAPQLQQLFTQAEQEFTQPAATLPLPAPVEPQAPASTGGLALPRPVPSGPSTSPGSGLAAPRPVPAGPSAAPASGSPSTSSGLAAPKPVPSGQATAPTGGLAAPKPVPAAPSAPPGPDSGLAAPSAVPANPETTWDPDREWTPSSRVHLAPAQVSGTNMVAYPHSGGGEGRIQISRPEDLEGMVIDFDRVDDIKATVFREDDAGPMLQQMLAEQAQEIANIADRQYREESRHTVMRMQSVLGDLVDASEKINEILLEGMSMDEGIAVLNAHGGPEAYTEHLLSADPAQMSPGDVGVLQELMNAVRMGEFDDSSLWDSYEAYSDAERSFRSVESHSADRVELALASPPIIFAFRDGWTGSKTTDGERVTGKYRVSMVVGTPIGGVDDRFDTFIASRDEMKRWRESGMFFTAYLEPVNE